MSQIQDIKNYMVKGNSITSIEALNLFGCFRLASRINDIKGLGIDVKSQFVKVDSGKDIKEYWINRADCIELLSTLFV